MKFFGIKLRNVGDELNDLIFKSMFEEKDRYKNYMIFLLLKEFVVKNVDMLNYRL